MIGKKSFLGASENDFHLTRWRRERRSPCPSLPTGSCLWLWLCESEELETAGAVSEQREGQEMQRLTHSSSLGLDVPRGAAWVTSQMWERAVCRWAKGNGFGVCWYLLNYRVQRRGCRWSWTRGLKLGFALLVQDVHERSKCTCVLSFPGTLKL